MSIYQEHGFDTRQEYLESLADDYGVEIAQVKVAAELLGEEEDFDGLLTELSSIQQLNQYTI